jgi:hypothetical protein
MSRGLEFLWGTALSTPNSVPCDIQGAVLKAAQALPVAAGVKDELHCAMHTPFTFQEFEHCRRHLTVGKSPGPSGLTTTQMKHWEPETARMVFDLSNVMWKHHHVPTWWQDRLMTFLPKEPDVHDLNKN